MKQYNLQITIEFVPQGSYYRIGESAHAIVFYIFQTSFYHP